MKRYFVNLPVDFLLVGGGSILLFAVLPFFQDGTRTPQIAQAGMWLTWLANWPHFSATNHRLYGKREHLKQYPITAIAAPLIVGAGVASSLAWPMIAAPLFVKIFLIWSPYHYSGQTLGISLLYGKRASYSVERVERFALGSFIYGTFLMRTLLAETSLQSPSYYGLQIPGFGVPRWIATGFEIWTHACLIVWLGICLYRYYRKREGVPVMYLLPPIAQYVWFAIAGRKAGYAELVPFFHGLQYLLIAWAMHVATADKPIAAESIRWYSINAIGGALLFFALPRAVGKLGVDANLATASILAAIQIHHFFVDGVIWKLKTQSVISPLLVNIPSLVAETPKQAALA